MRCAWCEEETKELAGVFGGVALYCRECARALEADSLEGEALEGVGEKNLSGAEVLTKPE